MTDKELLELAAKTIGLEYTVHDDEYYKTHVFFGLWMVKHHEPSEYERRYWNPLTDDGDALRLVVKCLPFYTLQYTDEDYENCNQDGYAATRRAIVRAAAEIGKELK